MRMNSSAGIPMLKIKLFSEVDSFFVDYISHS